MAVVVELQNVRVDRWLWAVRLFPTRTAASAACDGGHVKVNGASAKPATKIKVGDLLDVPGTDQKRKIEVVGLIEKRVGAVVAVTLLTDHTPKLTAEATPAVTFQRDRGAGRPTKKDRRELDRLRSASELAD
jgi:ribosome-associated heat shock protein Hsp15